MEIVFKCQGWIGCGVKQPHVMAVMQGLWLYVLSGLMYLVGILSG